MYIVKLGFTGVYVNFLLFVFAKNIDSGNVLRLYFRTDGMNEIGMVAAKGMTKTHTDFLRNEVYSGTFQFPSLLLIYKKIFCNNENQMTVR